MAAGDVVNDVVPYTVPGVFISFQPAAGIEVALTCIRVGDAPLYLTDGTALGFCTADPADVGSNTSNVRLLVNNTNYFTGGPLVSSAAASMYSGIQIK